MTTTADIATAPAPRRSISRLVWQMIAGVSVMMLVALALGYLLREPLERAGEWVITNFGIQGIFFATIFTDSSPLPLTNEPLMLLALSGGVGIWTVMVVVSAASVVGGAVGYSLGRGLGGIQPLRDWVLTRSPELASWMREKGAVAVAVAALLPIPYSLATWSAGLLGTPFWHVMAATLLRIPKTAFYLALIWLGWSTGGAI
jgi:membrane protein YqaA with SNARE-associated domain